MRKHKASAKCIKIKGIDKECVIASSDGACIIWDPVEARTRPLNPFCFLFAETHSCKEIIEMILVPNICHYLIKLFRNFCKASCKNTFFLRVCCFLSVSVSWSQIMVIGTAPLYLPLLLKEPQRGFHTISQRKQNFHRAPLRLMKFRNAQKLQTGVLVALVVFYGVRAALTGQRDIDRALFYQLRQCLFPQHTAYVTQATRWALLPTSSLGMTFSSLQWKVSRRKTGASFRGITLVNYWAKTLQNWLYMLQHSERKTLCCVFYPYNQNFELVLH